ncbi:MAG: shikimate kinase [Lachnospiraceae bacterium]|nr:shikimate kinase [Lachnospiraceae bacterium]
MRMKNNIILIGMPGVGKSTVGVILAKIMGYHFIDADIVIQQQEQKLLKDIIAEQGVEGFIQVENRINASIDGNQCIIATGGSVVYGEEAMEHYRRIGTVIYLKQSFDVLSVRLRDIRGRGVVLKPGQDLKDLYMERCSLYEKYADIVIDERNLNVEETIDKILAVLNP